MVLLVRKPSVKQSEIANQISSSKVDICKRGLELRTYEYRCPYFNRQILRMGERTFAITNRIGEAHDDLEKLDNFRFTLTSLLNFFKSLEKTSATTFYCRQPILRKDLMVYNSRLQDHAQKLGLLGVIDVKTQNMQEVQDAQDAQLDDKKIIAYVTANFGAVRTELQTYNRATAREAISTLLARQGNANDSETVILAECIRILRMIVGSSPDMPLEHDFPAIPDKGQRSTETHKSQTSRPRHVSFDSTPRHPSIKIPANVVKNVLNTPSPKSPLKKAPMTSPKSPRMPVREGSGIFICLKFETPHGTQESFEPFGHMWGWADPVVVTEAMGMHDFLVQTGSLLQIHRPFRNWNSALDHANSLGLIEHSKLSFLPGIVNDEVLVLAIFRIRGTCWVAGVEKGKPGLIPLDCLGPETSRPVNKDVKVVSRQLHEHARPFSASRVLAVGQGKVKKLMGRPVKGVVGKRFLSYFDSEIGDPIGFFHHLHELKFTKGIREAITIEGVGTFNNVPCILLEENGVVHELLFEDEQKQIGFHDDIRRMQLRGVWM